MNSGFKFFVCLFQHDKNPEPVSAIFLPVKSEQNILSPLRLLIVDEMLILDTRAFILNYVNAFLFKYCYFCNYTIQRYKMLQ